MILTVFLLKILLGGLFLLTCQSGRFWKYFPMLMLVSLQTGGLNQITFLFLLQPCLFEWFLLVPHSLKSLYEVHTINFQTFFVWALLLILPSNLFRLQCTCCTVPTTSGRPHGSSIVWACQWPSSQPLSSPQLSHNDSLWALGISKSRREQGLDYRDAEELS